MAGLLSKFFDEGKRRSYEEEIISHLTHILNTRRGYGAWQRGFGLKSYSSNNQSQKVIEEIQEDITTNIEQFEKRVEVIDIQNIADLGELSLGFRIRCRFKGNKRSLAVVFNQKKDSVKVEVES